MSNRDNETIIKNRRHVFYSASVFSFLFFLFNLSMLYFFLLTGTKSFYFLSFVYKTDNTFLVYAYFLSADSFSTFQTNEENRYASNSFYRFAISVNVGDSTYGKNIYFVHLYSADSVRFRDILDNII